MRTLKYTSVYCCRNEKAEERLKALNESLKAECGKFDGEVTSIRISLEAKDAELKKLAAVLSESQALVKKQRALLMTQDTRLQNTAKLESQLRELQKNYEVSGIHDIGLKKKKDVLFVVILTIKGFC